MTPIKHIALRISDVPAHALKSVGTATVEDSSANMSIMPWPDGTVYVWPLDLNQPAYALVQEQGQITVAQWNGHRWTQQQHDVRFSLDA